MTANKIYYPSYYGGKIVGVQLVVQNTTGSDISCSSENGVYYTFDGRDYQILSLRGVTVPAGETVIITEDKVQALTPTHDIKIMVDTAGLADCIANCQVTWEVA